LAEEATMHEIKRVAEESASGAKMASAIRGLSQLAKLLLKLAKQERLDIDAGVPHDQIYPTLRLASNVSLVKFVPMIPRFTSYAVSLLAIAFLMSGCASRDESVVEESTSQSEATVGDEKVPDKPAFTPGSQGTSAQHGSYGGF
jgi:hypothetical protein